MILQYCLIENIKMRTLHTEICHWLTAEGEGVLALLEARNKQVQDTTLDLAKGTSAFAGKWNNV